MLTLVHFGCKQYVFWLVSLKKLLKKCEKNFQDKTISCIFTS